MKTKLLFMPGRLVFAASPSESGGQSQDVQKQRDAMDNATQPFTEWEARDALYKKVEAKYDAVRSNPNSSKEEMDQAKSLLLKVQYLQKKEAKEVTGPTLTPNELDANVSMASQEAVVVQHRLNELQALAKPSPVAKVQEESPPKGVEEQQVSEKQLNSSGVKNLIKNAALKSNDFTAMAKGNDGNWYVAHATPQLGEGNPTVRYGIIRTPASTEPPRLAMNE